MRIRRARQEKELNWNDLLVYDSLSQVLAIEGVFVNALIYTQVSP